MSRNRVFSKEREETKTGNGHTTSGPEEVEQVMNNGMQFLAGLFKMATGKDMNAEDQKVKVNKETGEVTFTFKMPV